MPRGKEKRSQRLSKARHPLPHRGKSFKLDGVETADATVAGDLTGHHTVEIVMSDSFRMEPDADNMDIDINDFKIKSLRLTEL
ncbi:MAG: hypothetical protein J5976_06525 [Bacteroidales bacterium]|nr:hypothetical protein [Bacteroidales bacterium]